MVKYTITFTTSTTYTTTTTTTTTNTTRTTTTSTTITTTKGKYCYNAIKQYIYIFSFTKKICKLKMYRLMYLYMIDVLTKT